MAKLGLCFLTRWLGEMCLQMCKKCHITKKCHHLVWLECGLQRERVESDRRWGLDHEEHPLPLQSCKNKKQNAKLGEPLNYNNLLRERCTEGPQLQCGRTPESVSGQVTRGQARRPVFGGVLCSSQTLLSPQTSDNSVPPCGSWVRYGTHPTKNLPCWQSWAEALLGDENISDHILEIRSRQL